MNERKKFPARTRHPDLEDASRGLPHERSHAAWCALLTSGAQIVLLILAVGLLAPVPGRAEQRASVAKALENLQATLDRLRLEEGFPGAVAAFVLRGGGRGVAATGMADLKLGTPMQTNARMPAGSVGKTFVATLVLDLVNEGKLDLDTPIERWLRDRPWFAQVPNAGDITLRLLLNHSSGIPDYAFSSEYRWAAVKRRLRTWSVDARFTTEELIQLSLDQGPLFSPGSGHSYSDTGYLLVGLIIEKVTGRSFYEVLESRLLEPLKLKNTVPTRGRCYAHLATGHLKLINLFFLPRRIAENGCLLIDPGTEWTGGGIVSNVADLALWARLLYEGDALAGPYLEEMLQSRSLVMEGVYYGLGVRILESPLGTAYAHQGYLPGYVTQLLYLPHPGVAVAFQVNRDYDLDVYKYGLALAEEVIRAAPTPGRQR